MNFKKNLNFTYLMLSLLILLALFQSGCGKSEEGKASGFAIGGRTSTGATEIELSYRADQLDTPEGLGTARKLALSGDTLYVAGRLSDDTPTLYAMNSGSRDWQALNYDHSHPSAARILDLSATDSRLFVVSCSILGTEGSDTPLVTVYDTATGESTGRFELREFSRTEPSQTAAVEDKLLCVKSDADIYIYSEQGKLLNQVQPSGIFRSVSVLEGRVILCCASRDDSYGFWELDVDSGRLTNLWSSRDAGLIPPNLSCSSQNGGLTGDSIALYRYDLATGEQTQLFNWLDYGISGIFELSPAMSEKGEIFVVDRERLLVLRMQEGPVRRVLTIGAAGYGLELDAIVSEFNRENGEYVARMKLYPPEQGDRLLTEIAAGMGPDILLTGEWGPLSSVTADGGIFVDLMPYIDADPDISREDFLPMALEGMAPDGHLYLLAPAMKAESLLTHKTVWDRVPDWTLDALFTLSRDCDQSRTLFGCSKEQMLDTICAIASVQYVDFENVSCSFDAPSFARWLELAGSIDYYQYPATESALLYMHGLSAWDAVSLGDSEGLQIVGFPGEDGPLHLFSAANGYGVLANSPNTEGAWQFLRRMLLPGTQSTLDGIPVIKACVNAALTTNAAGYYQYVETELAFDNWMASIRPNIEKIAVLADEGVLIRPSAIDDIIRDEANRYFSGQKPLAEAVASIQSQAGVFLSEQYT